MVWNIACALVILIAMWADASVRLWYSQGLGFPGYELLLIVAKSGIALLLAWCLSLRCKGADRSRMLVWSVALVLGADFLARTMGIWPDEHLLKACVVSVVIGAAAIGIRYSYGMPSLGWRRTALALATFSVVFHSVPSLTALTVAPRVSWMARSAEIPAAERSVEAFLLLDELSVTEARSIVDAVEAGFALPVRFKSVTAPGRHTMEALPAMLSGRRLDGARPCTPTAVCGGSGAFDFGRVTAGRSDVSVVGFYHPYCAIRRLEFCSVRYVADRRFKWSRYKCAFERAFGWASDEVERQCREVTASNWLTMADEIAEDVWRSPVWSDGGVIFAHLPFPHPPSRLASASLAVDYRENVTRAVALVVEVVRRATSVAGTNVHIVITSDHPLRARYWCSEYWPYVRKSCMEDARSLVSVDVPLVEIGRQVEEFHAVTDGIDAFRMLAH